MPVGLRASVDRPGQVRSGQPEVRSQVRSGQVYCSADVVGTTRHSEQNHVPNHDSKEKEFKLKENSGLKAHESFSESSILSRSSVVPVLGVYSFGQAAGCGESALQIVSTAEV